MEYQKLNTLTLSEQAKREIHKYIKNMDLSRNNKLPREEVLAEMIGVSRITIRQALNDLASEGIIFRRQGKRYLCKRRFSQYQGQIQPLYGIYPND